VTWGIGHRTPLGILRHTRGVDAERDQLKAVLVETRGNIRRTAVLLAMCRRQVYYRIDALELREFVGQQREKAHVHRTKTRAWLARTKEELCHGRDDLDADCGVSGDDGW
jgi:hypothetical protein